MSLIRIIKHEAVPRCGSYEVRFSDGRPSKYFYWDDEPSRRLRPELLTGEEALWSGQGVCSSQEIFRLMEPDPCVYFWTVPGTSQQISSSWLVQRVGSSFAYHHKFRLRHKAGAILAAVCQINLRPGTVSQAHQ